MVNMQKVAVIGCGFVGATSAFSLIQTGLFSEMVLIDANTKKAEGEAMDLSHGSAYLTPMNIYAGTYDDIKRMYKFLKVLFQKLKIEIVKVFY